MGLPMLLQCLMCFHCRHIVKGVFHVGGLAPPLYIHTLTQGSIQGRLSEASPETEWEQRVTQLFSSQVRCFL